MMKFKKLLAFAKRLALKLAQKEIERIIAKPDKPADVAVSATDGGVVLAGKDLKARAVTEAQVRDIAR